MLLVGAGAVGIELAGEIKSKWPAKHVILLDAVDDVLGHEFRADLRAELRAQLEEIGVELVLGERLRDLPATPATEIAPFTVTTDAGREIAADMWFRCFGVHPESDYLGAELAPARRADGFVEVGPALQVAGFDNVFAIGDVSTADAKMAGRAGRQAHLVAENIRKLINGDHDLTAYEPIGPAIIVPIGPEARQRAAAESAGPRVARDGVGREGPRPHGRPLRRDPRGRDPGAQRPNRLTRLRVVPQRAHERERDERHREQHEDPRLGPLEVPVVARRLVLHDRVVAEAVEASHRAVAAGALARLRERERAAADRVTGRVVEVFAHLPRPGRQVAAACREAPRERLHVVRAEVDGHEHADGGEDADGRRERRQGPAEQRTRRRARARPRTAANAMGTMFCVSNCAPSNRLPSSEFGVPDHHVTSALTAALVTSVPTSTAATFVKSQRRRVTVCVHTRTLVACSRFTRDERRAEERPRARSAARWSGGPCR